MILKKIFYINLLLLFAFFLCICCSDFPNENDNKIDSLVHKARVEMSNLDYIKTIKFAKQAEILAIKYDRKEKLPDIYLEIADGLSGLELQKESFFYLDRILKMNFDRKDHIFKSRVYQIFAYNYEEIGLDSRFLDYSRKAIYLLENKTTYPEIFFLSTSYGNLGYYYYSNKNSDSSFYYYKKQEIVLKSFPNNKYGYAVNNLAALYNIKGYLHLESKKQKDSALYYFKKGLDLKMKYNNAKLDSEYLGLGDYYFLENKYSEALVFYLKAQHSAKIQKTEFNDNNDINKVLAETYDALGDTKNASLYLKKYAKNEDSIQKNRETQFDTVVNLLVQRNTAETTLAVRKNNKITLASVISFLLLIGGVFFYHNRKRKNRATTENEVLLKERQNIITQKEEETQELKLRVNESFDDVIQLAKDNSREFFTRFEEVYPEVISKLLKIDGKLRVTELTLCAYFYLGFTTKDVAFYTFKSVNTIRNRRQSLRNKLHISKDDNLELWFKNLKKIAL